MRMQLAATAGTIVALVMMTPAAGRAEYRRPSDSASAGAAQQLYERLLAPCCWIQTLDIHDSPLSTELRQEVVVRLRQGEPPAAIEQALAARYGERIRAVPAGRDPRQTMALVVFSALAAVLSVLVRMARRWQRGEARPQSSERRADTQARNEGAQHHPGASDPYDAQLDRELASTKSVI